MLLVAPLLPSPETDAQYRVAAYVTHAAWYALVVTFAAAVTAWWQLRRGVLVAVLVGSFALAMACNVLDLDIVSDVAKLWFGALAGAAFVRLIERPWWLLAIAVAVPLADAWSVFSSRGVTNAVVERAREEPRWLDWPTIATPVAGVPYEYFGRLGVVDILFCALFLAVARRWHLGLRRVAVALCFGLLASSVLAFELDDVAIPALPLLCVAFLAATMPALVRDARAAARGQ